MDFYLVLSVFTENIRNENRIGFIKHASTDDYCDNLLVSICFHNIWGANWRGAVIKSFAEKGGGY